MAETVCMLSANPIDQDQRGHDVEEQIELETEPAEEAERPRNRDDRWKRRNKHQRTRLKKTAAMIAPKSRPSPL